MRSVFLAGSCRYGEYGREERQKVHKKHVIFDWSTLFCVFIHIARRPNTPFPVYIARHLPIKLSASQNQSTTSSKMWRPIFKARAVNVSLTNTPPEFSSFSGLLTAVSHLTAEIWLQLYNFLFTFSDTYGLMMAALRSRNTQLFYICYDSAVGIATRYGLDGPGIESQWGRDFPHSSRPALWPTQSPVQWVPGLSRG